ncbi:MAG: ATP-binding cassette domain-containing protein [Polyangiaceae bacterium]|nr:ATP-binding cassette domain-containing protein [Polyangiaceae bacterium]MCL4750228.1 ATP-binding cassette domain-containing protein [Myxococcales bacterium]
MAVLEFEDVWKRYGDKVALSGVSFDVRPGEVFGLLGPNGAGKTTSIRILMDIVRADAGKVTLFGQPLTRGHLDRLAYLPEERGLYTKQKVIDVMIYFGKLKGLGASEARARARTWLERIGLASTENQHVERLSKGMGQKVQLAATLLSEPELCVLDEPFSGLDPVNTALVRDLIGEIRASGRTTILSTHQMSMVETLCDRVALLSEGKLMVYGEVNEVRRRYSSSELRVGIQGELPELPEVEQSVVERPGTYRLVLAEGADPQRVLERLLEAKVPVERYERVLAPMEDIFIRVVKNGAA